MTYRISEVTRLRALEVMDDTDTWTGGDWQRTCILLASAIIAACDDFDRLPSSEPGVSPSTEVATAVEARPTPGSDVQVVDYSRKDPP